MLFFIWPIHHLCGFGPPFGNEGGKGLLRLLINGLQVSSCHVHLYIVLVLVMDSLQMSSQFLALLSSTLRNHLRVAPVKVFWNICTNISSVAPRGYIALIYIFRWDLGQPVPSNLSKTGILNFEGNLTSRKRESD